ncbi:hypothetical protein [Variovorax guangxiensis]|uniref:hypothetical protein n=1 Tax=Variovorax guangxiensis TaxID=1775474 RepID=UPI002864B276|nr:hypothetical protein [Variovorax guangxiensis]MDR6856027.1 exoribonuclease II [Variovorax guangxiensis]
MPIAPSFSKVSGNLRMRVISPFRDGDHVDLRCRLESFASTAASNSPTLSLKGLSPSHYAAWQSPSFLFEGHAQ